LVIQKKIALTSFYNFNITCIKKLHKAKSSDEILDFTSGQTSSPYTTEQANI